MEKKKAMVKGLRPIMLLVQHIALIVVAVCVAFIWLNTGVKVDKGGNGTWYYSINPLDNSESFEDNHLFYQIFRDDVYGVLQNVVMGSQMGADGQYHSDTLINISEYANRKDVIYDGEDVTAVYRLDDLLKWYQGGFYYEETMFDTLEEFIWYFRQANSEGENQENQMVQTGVTRWEYLFREVVGEDEAWEEMDPMYADIFRPLQENGINYNLIRDEEGKVVCVGVSMISDRYRTADGKKLSECAADWAEYGTLMHNLQVSVNDLGYNYNMFKDSNDSLQKENTNLRYHVQLVKDGKVRWYTNDTSVQGSEDMITRHYQEMGKYLMYYSENMYFNTDISYANEDLLLEVTGMYEYVFRDGVKVWIGVDGNYPVQDVYSQARSVYGKSQDVWTYVGIGAAAALIWLFLLIYLSVMAGRVRNKEGQVILDLQWFDYIPTEVALALAGGLTAGFIFYVALLGDYGEQYFVRNGQDTLLIDIILCTAGLTSAVFTTFWYSFIRRLKAHAFWKNSLCGWLLRWFLKLYRKIRQSVKNGMAKAYGHMGTISRVAVPFGLLLLGNILLALLAGTWIYYDVDLTILGMLLVLALVMADGAFLYHIIKSVLGRQQIAEGIVRISEGDMDYQLDAEGLTGENLELANAVNNIGAGMKKAVETSMKDERMKADLITNVSHDIKTPLTSIINYVDLLKRENIETEPVKGYIEVLDQKSQRLKQLTDDLVEASKISSGNIVLNMEKINLTELLKQSVGEFTEKFEKKSLTVIESYAEEPHIICADSRRMWRVVENLFNNIYKYAMEGTRVYIDIMRNRFGEKNQILLSVKNISAQALNISPDELTERFIRGDESRTTEGSGLGLSIAKNLVEAQNGKFNIILDGDLFKVVILFEEELSETE